VDEVKFPQPKQGRVLSVSVQLSAPESYSGGELYLGPSMASRGQGDVIIFDSALPHTVTPVTRGMRFSLVAWVRGNAGGLAQLRSATQLHRHIMNSSAWLHTPVAQIHEASRPQRPPPDETLGDHVPTRVQNIASIQALALQLHMGKSLDEVRAAARAIEIE